jgi:hypothetical protein
MDIWMTGSAPVHSKTTSKPKGASNSDRAACAFSLARRSCSSLVLALSVGERQYVCDANPWAFAKSSRVWLMSIATTRAAPSDFATAQARRPIAPTPKTRIFWPGVTLARREAWMRTERGSARAAWSKLQLSGRLEGSVRKCCNIQENE